MREYKEPTLRIILANEADCLCGSPNQDDTIFDASDWN